MNIRNNIKNLKYKILFIICIILLGLSTVLASQYKIKQKPFTVMIYMNASDLESNGRSEGTINILKMLAADIDEKNINVILEIGGTKKWTNTYGLDFAFRKKGKFNPPYIEDILPESDQKLPSWFGKEVNPNKNIRYKVEKGDLKQLKSLEKRNMGEPDTLSSFINYGMENFPAEKYALVFWGHGHVPIKGFAYDENFENDTLTLLETITAFENSKVKDEKLDFILFDACYMANVEVAYTFKDYAYYLVASQDTSNFGTAYNKWLRELSLNPYAPTEEITKNICDSYQNMRTTYNEWELSMGNDYLDELPQTFSVIKLDQIAEVVDQIEKLFSKQESYNEKMFDQLVQQAISRTSFVKDTEVNLMDARDFCDQFEKQINNSTTIKGLRRALSKAVVYNTAKSNEVITSGLSIYMPRYTIDTDVVIQEQLELYKQFAFAPSYTQYIEKVIHSQNNK